MRDIVLQPRQLLGPERSHAPVGKVDGVDQRDEMGAVGIETIPAVALRALAEAVEERAGVGAVDDVMLARDEMNRQVEFTEQLLRDVELFGGREMRDIAGVDDEIGLYRQRAHLGDRCFQRADDVGVCLLLEADMCVADLEETARLDRRRVARLGRGR